MRTRCIFLLSSSICNIWPYLWCRSNATVFLGNLNLCLVSLTVEIFFLKSNLNLSFFNFKPFPPVLSLHTIVKSSSPVLFQAPFGYCKVLYRHSVVLSRLNNPNSLSLSPWDRCSSPLNIFMASSGFTSSGPCPSYVGGSRAVHALLLR